MLTDEVKIGLLGLAEFFFEQLYPDIPKPLARSLFASLYGNKNAEPVVQEVLMACEERGWVARTNGQVTICDEMQRKMLGNGRKVTTMAAL